MGSRRRLEGKGSEQAMSLRRLAGLATLCGMVVLLVWVSAGRIGVGSPDVRNTKVRTEQPRVTPGIAASERIDAPQGTALGKGSASVGRSFRPPVLDGDVLGLNMAQFAQLLPECV